MALLFLCLLIAFFMAAPLWWLAIAQATIHRQRVLLRILNDHCDGYGELLRAAYPHLPPDLQDEARDLVRSAGAEMEGFLFSHGAPKDRKPEKS